jgi:hypothetical protein
MKKMISELKTRVLTDQELKIWKINQFPIENQWSNLVLHNLFSIALIIITTFNKICIQ